MNFFTGILIGVIVGYFYGWTGAHKTVAEECEKLGKFFVGKNVYECSRIIEKVKEPTT